MINYEKEADEIADAIEHIGLLIDKHDEPNHIRRRNACISIVNALYNETKHMITKEEYSDLMNDNPILKNIIK